MKNIGILTVSFLILFSANLFSQEKNEIVAYFENTQDVLSVDGETALSSFYLKVDEVQLDVIKMKAQRHINGYELTVSETLNKDGNYECSLTFKFKADMAYLHKTFLFFEVAKFQYNNTLYNLDQFLSTVK
ncbi:MAG: hypothetical protein HN704_18505 [Bacteroidetes bacterium]|jgi:hypothetical protein|nr:hypothetical protein [Bacteroidota bacterium]MBT6686089.1 hypothetical protein [Bacteroidota bacterium]MBT7142018.1 hypothetical protein [Bacteroidota bacterium]MBT7493596.1 hypothetical protein [Bacteroidota bacterium]